MNGGQWDDCWVNGADLLLFGASDLERVDWTLHTLWSVFSADIHGCKLLTFNYVLNPGEVKTKQKKCCQPSQWLLTSAAFPTCDVFASLDMKCRPDVPEFPAPAATSLNPLGPVCRLTDTLTRQWRLVSPPPPSDSFSFLSKMRLSQNVPSPRLVFAIFISVYLSCVGCVCVEEKALCSVWGDLRDCSGERLRMGACVCVCICKCCTVLTCMHKIMLL